MVFSQGVISIRLMFWVLSNQYAERSAYANVFKFNRENTRFERAKVNSKCFHWFPAAMLESFNRTATWRLLTKDYNFQWNPLPHDSRSEYRTSPKLWHVVYLLLFYKISIPWLNLLLAWRENHQRKRGIIIQKIDTDYKRQNWNWICAKFFKPFNGDVSPLNQGHRFP